MFKELLELGQRLEQEGQLPPPGFYFYKEPIKWVIHFYPDKPSRSTIRQAAIDKLPRPYSGRTSGTQAYPLADEAAYVLGIYRGKGKDTKKKHSEFLQFLNKIAAGLKQDNPAISRLVGGIKNLIESGRLKSSPQWNDIESKDWVSFQVEGPGGDGKQLFQHPAITRLWIEELAERCLPGDGKAKCKPTGECGISGKGKSVLVGRIPLAVTLFKPAPLHSLNADAFVSGMEGTGVFKRCHVGQSIEAGDLIARTLNYLRSQPLHHKILAKAIEAGKLNTDSLQNLFAFYWIEQPVEARRTLSIDPAELLSKATLLFGENNDGDSPETTKEKGDSASKEKAKMNLPVDLSQLEALVKIPWTGQQHALHIDDNAFCLLMFSPNKGRVSIREWFKVGLGHLKANLKAFLDSQRIEAPNGSDARCFAISDLLRALEESNISQPEYKAKEIVSPNISRMLLRCAYVGETPPVGLLEPAVICFRHPKVLQRHEQKHDRERFAQLQHQLAAIMKLILTHPNSEVRMNGDVERSSLGDKSPAFLSGCLLAVLEEAQLAAASWKINTTIIDQFYSTAASAPCTVLGMLVSRVTSQHMPKLRKNLPGKYAKLESLLESIQDDLHSLGGFPKILTLKQQAEFSLGFYTQRAAFSRERPPRKTMQTSGQPLAEQGA
jgi:CRISPR-associated protein Csd1